MSTMLGNIELSEHIILRGLTNWLKVQFDTKRTIDGLFIANPSPKMRGGRPLILDGNDGHLTVGQLKAVLELQSRGEPVLLQHHQGQFSVWITNITSPELWFLNIADYDDNDEVSAQIELMEAI